MACVIARTQLPVDDVSSSIQSSEIIMHVDIAAVFLESGSCEYEMSTRIVPTKMMELRVDA